MIFVGDRKTDVEQLASGEHVCAAGGLGAGVTGSVLGADDMRDGAGDAVYTWGAKAGQVWHKLACCGFTEAPTVRESRVVGATLPPQTCLLGRYGIESVEERQTEGEVKGIVLLNRCGATMELDGGGAT